MNQNSYKTNYFKTSIMASKTLIYVFLFLARESSQTPNYGKITITNKSKEVLRVTLSSAINWNYHEQRTNRTLLRNPDKITGGNIIM